MKKYLKIFVITIVAYTAGEFVTMWRLQTDQVPFKQFTKDYFKGDPKDLKHLNDMYASLDNDNRDEAMTHLKAVIFPNREQ